MLISIIIPTYNNAQRLSQCITSIKSQQFSLGEVEIIVVDNGSIDHTSDTVKKWPEIRYLTQTQIKSPYPTRNMGIRAANGDYIVLLDANCIPGENWLQAGIQSMIETNIDVGAGNIQFSFGNNPSAAELADSLLHVNVKRDVMNGGAPGGNLFVKKNVFEQYGYFPEYLRSNGDTVWSNNVTKHGGKIHFIEEAKSYYPAKKLDKLLKKQFRIGYGNRSVWINANKSQIKIILMAMWNMRPMPIIELKRLIKERGSLIHKQKFLSIWIILSLCKICRGLGRLGIKIKE